MDSGLGKRHQEHCFLTSSRRFPDEVENKILWACVTRETTETFGRRETVKPRVLLCTVDHFQLLFFFSLNLSAHRQGDCGVSAI